MHPPRVKVRLQRAITQTLLNPTRGAPTLRRTVVMVAKELRRCGFSEERIRTLFARVIEDVACVRSLHRTSLMSGQPRWAEVFARVDSWLGATHEQTEPHS